MFLVGALAHPNSDDMEMITGFAPKIGPNCHDEYLFKWAFAKINAFILARRFKMFGALESPKLRHHIARLVQPLELL